MYSAIFEAVVVGGIDPKTNKLSFELRGEATLPQVVVQNPTSKNKSGIPTLKFKKLLLGRVQALPIVLYNDGIIPATVKVTILQRCKRAVQKNSFHFVSTQKKFRFSSNISWISIILYFYSCSTTL